MQNIPIYTSRLFILFSHLSSATLDTHCCESLPRKSTIGCSCKQRRKDAFERYQLFKAAKLSKVTLCAAHQPTNRLAIAFVRRSLDFTPAIDASNGLVDFDELSSFLIPLAAALLSLPHNSLCV